MKTEPDIAVVIPALNEEQAIGSVIEAIPRWVSRVIVADNGSTDATAETARLHGAVVVHEPRRGYGAACLRALSAVETPDIVVFLDADNSDDPREMTRLIAPLLHGRADLVIGSRALGRPEPGALTLPQRFGNVLASALLRLLWRGDCTDLGPFRAIRFVALQALGMNDLDYGWTVQMQARAFKAGLRVAEVPVSYRKRVGRSKISGTVRGVIGAGTKILTTIARERIHRSPRPFVRQRLLFFTRYPEAGKTKTRMIPALGPEGAADLQREMTRHVLHAAQRWLTRPERGVTVHFNGGDIACMRETFGEMWRYVPQDGASLGERLYRAFTRARDEGAGAIVAIGADCPTVDQSVIEAAFDALGTHDAVLGPASDGGYYLIGLREPVPALFQNIFWGTDHVLDQTLAIMAGLGLSVARLEERDDVDAPADLPVWERARDAAGERACRPRLSVIIPARNEAAYLPETLASIGRQPLVETIVADGGSSDGTDAIASASGARVTRSAPGRATQMNAGAQAARGDILLFLHGDSRLPFGYLAHVEAALAQDGVAAGAFRLAFDDVRPSLRLIEQSANWRAAYQACPYGDQGLFMRRETFRRMGGFREMPVMEDCDMARRLRIEGRIAIVPAPVITSARRYLRHGSFRVALMHKQLALAWRLGIDPSRLSRWREGA